MEGIEDLLKDIESRTNQPMSEEQKAKFKEEYKSDYGLLLDFVAKKTGQPITQEQKDALLTKYGLKKNTTSNSSQTSTQNSPSTSKPVEVKPTSTTEPTKVVQPTIDANKQVEAQRTSNFNSEKSKEAERTTAPTPAPKTQPLTLEQQNEELTNFIAKVDNAQAILDPNFKMPEAFEPGEEKQLLDKAQEARKLLVENPDTWVQYEQAKVKQKQVQEQIEEVKQYEIDKTNYTEYPLLAISSWLASKLYTLLNASLFSTTEPYHEPIVLNNHEF